MVLIFILAVVIVLGLAFYKIYSELGLKMADPRMGVMDGDGMLNPNAVKMACEEIQGEYERGVGSRVIIEGTHFIEKSRQNNIADAEIIDAYSTSDAPDRLILKLDNDKVVEEGREIATIKECYVENKVLHVIEEFVYGECDLDFDWTDQPEFYYYDIVTEKYMPELEGIWKNENELYFRIQDNSIEFSYDGTTFGEKENICIIQENTSENGRIFVSNEDLYVDGVGMYTRFEYRDGNLYAYMMVTDADAKLEEFVKVK